MLKQQELWNKLRDSMCRCGFCVGMKCQRESDDVWSRSDAVNWARVAACAQLLVQPVVDNGNVLSVRFHYYQAAEVRTALSNAGVCSIARCVEGFAATYELQRKRKQHHQFQNRYCCSDFLRFLGWFPMSHFPFSLCNFLISLFCSEICCVASCFPWLCVPDFQILFRN